MATTIQISEKLHKELYERKLFSAESYEDVIWDMLEDTRELSDETIRLIRQSEKDMKDGRMRTLDEVKRELDV